MRSAKRVRLYDPQGKETFSDGNEIWRRLGAKEEKQQQKSLLDPGNAEEDSEAASQDPQHLEEVNHVPRQLGNHIM